MEDIIEINIQDDDTIEIDEGAVVNFDYSVLTNKPKINNVELNGNKDLHDLGIQAEGNYVEVETGKGLSTNDFTDTYKDNVESNTSARHTHSNKSVLDGISSTDVNNWNNKAETSDIPDVSNFIDKNVNNLVNYTLKTNTGSLIDLEINQTTYVVTLSLKDQDGNVISTDTIDLPLENVVVSGSYDSTNQKIVLTLQSGDTVDIPVGALVSGLQSEITSQNKLASDLIDDSNSGNKFVTPSEKQTWNNKLDASKVKNSNSTTSGDVYDVTYINTMIGDIESLLAEV